MAGNKVHYLQQPRRRLPGSKTPAAFSPPPLCDAYSRPQVTACISSGRRGINRADPFKAATRAAFIDRLFRHDPKRRQGEGTVAAAACCQ